MFKRSVLRAPMLRPVPLARAVVYMRPFHTSFVVSKATWRPIEDTRPKQSTPKPRVWHPNQDVTYEELKPITEAPNDEILLLDVRQPNEVIQGSIPSSVNLPLDQFERALALDEADFYNEYKFKKPRKDQKIITYCRAGVRAKTAQDIAGKAGYTLVRVYDGSWLDWEAKNKTDPFDED